MRQAARVLATALCLTLIATLPARAIGLLRDAGVKSFIITADHGFLLHDDTTRKPIAHGRKIDTKRRHVIETAAADHAGESRVSSTELRYDGDEVGRARFARCTQPPPLQPEVAGVLAW